MEEVREKRWPTLMSLVFKVEIKCLKNLEIPQ